MSGLYDALKKDNSLGRYLGVYLSNTTREKKHLFSVTIQLLPTCNLKCKMCYARMTSDEISAEGRHILSFDEWKPLLDELIDNGVYICSLTGGECTLHPDFCKIYSYCYDKGMAMSVLTNGTCITDEIFSLFVQKPPSSIYITLYGSSPETYARLCGNSSAFYSAHSSIMRLKAQGINVFAQFTAVKDNLCDLYDIYQLTKEHDIVLIYSHHLSEFDRCSAEVVQNNQVDESEYIKIKNRIECDKAGIEYSDGFEPPEAFSAPQSASSKKGIRCGAARNTCYLNWRGDMQPCVTFDDIVRHPLKEGLMNSWNVLSEWAMQVEPLTECDECIFRNKCLTCVAAHYCDMGKMGVVSPRLCWKRQNPREAEEAYKRYEARKQEKNGG